MSQKLRVIVHRWQASSHSFCVELTSMFQLKNLWELACQR